MKRRHSFAALFPPLLASLSAREGDEVVLTFDELLEALWGEPLPLRAKVNTHVWTARALPHVRVLHAVGWRAHLDYVHRRVVFRRVPVETREG